MYACMYVSICNCWRQKLFRLWFTSQQEGGCYSPSLHAKLRRKALKEPLMENGVAWEKMKLESIHGYLIIQCTCWPASMPIEQVKENWWKLADWREGKLSSLNNLASQWCEFPMHEKITKDGGLGLAPNPTATDLQCPAKGGAERWLEMVELLLYENNPFLHLTNGRHQRPVMVSKGNN